MFGIGSTELLVILVVALLVLGPKNLPKIAHTLGRAMGEFRRVSTEFQRTLNTEIAFEEEKAKKQTAAARATQASGTEKPDAHGDGDVKPDRMDLHG
jgi:sec-independent protein translocase protein TatB